MGKTEGSVGKMNLTDLFPKLNADNHEITSPKTIKYNCIAWAAGNTDHWWQPGVHWPMEASRDDYGLGNAVAAFKSLGYEECDDGTPEDGFMKLALYGSSMMYTHAARQLPDGRWTSKLGQLEDITHTTTDVIECGAYGEVVQYMERAV
jgi:hypothetical protein